MSAPREVDLAEGVLTRDAMAVVTDPDVDIVVESIGGIEPARELILAALAHGKPVVTANKELARKRWCRAVQRRRRSGS